MVRINLLPDEFAAQHRRKSGQNRIIILSLLLVVLFTAVNCRLYLLQTRVYAQAAGATGKRVALRRKLPDLKTRKSCCRKQKDWRIVARAVGGSFDWRGALASLVYNLPERIRIKNIVITFDGLEGLISLRGGQQPHACGGMVKDAAKIAGISNVRIIYSAKKQAPLNRCSLSFLPSIPRTEPIRKEDGVSKMGKGKGFVVSSSSAYSGGRISLCFCNTWSIRRQAGS